MCGRPQAIRELVKYVQWNNSGISLKIAMEALELATHDQDLYRMTKVAALADCLHLHQFVHALTTLCPILVPITFMLHG